MSSSDICCCGTFTWPAVNRMHASYVSWWAFCRGAFCLSSLVLMLTLDLSEPPNITRAAVVGFSHFRQVTLSSNNDCCLYKSVRFRFYVSGTPLMWPFQLHLHCILPVFWALTWHPTGRLMASGSQPLPPVAALCLHTAWVGGSRAFGF